jgi:hypothetical protein
LRQWPPARLPGYQRTNTRPDPDEILREYADPFHLLRTLPYIAGTGPDYT